MKKQLLCLMMLVFALLPIKVHAEGIVLNSDNFPDANMLTAVTAYDTNTDGVLDADEIAAVTLLDLNDKELTDLTGIKFFTSATIIWLENNSFISADFSGMTNVEQIVFDYTYSMTSLNITGCSKLRILSTIKTGITSLDLTGTPLMNAVIEKGPATGPDMYDLDLITHKPINYSYMSNDGTIALGVSIGTTFGTKVEEKAATHTSDGVKAHYELGSHYYEDGACLKEITEVVIPKVEHSYDTYEVKDLTTHLKKCSCGDSIPEAHSFDSTNVCTVCLYKEYQILDGSDTEVTKGAEEDVKVHSEGELNDFVKLEVDGSEVSGEDYTKEGNIIITLKNNFVESLSVGDHEINIHFKDGMSSTTLAVKETTSNTATTQTTTVEENETATVPIFNNITLVLGAVILVLVGIIIGLLLNRKKG